MLQLWLRFSCNFPAFKGTIKHFGGMLRWATNQLGEPNVSEWRLLVSCCRMECCLMGRWTSAWCLLEEKQGEQAHVHQFKQGYKDTLHVHLSMGSVCSLISTNSYNESACIKWKFQKKTPTGLNTKVYFLTWQQNIFNPKVHLLAFSSPTAACHAPYQWM